MGTPFTSNWIQALMSAASLPVTRTIKPSLEWIDRICVDRGQAEVLEAAKQLWDYAARVGLQDLLLLLPASEEHWRFLDDDSFLYQRVEPEKAQNFAGWTAALGVTVYRVSLKAEVTQADWSTLVRREAVRLQKSFDVGATAQTKTLSLPCEATWDEKRWTVRFTAVDWLEIDYEEPAVVPRPNADRIRESIDFALAAGEELLKGRMPAIESQSVERDWITCSEPLYALHDYVISQKQDLSPWMRRLWSAVWPVIYREQNILAGRADLEIVRAEMHQCLKHAPQATVWMFVLAKLVCETQLGRGLGRCADYVDNFEA